MIIEQQAPPENPYFREAFDFLLAWKRAPFDIEIKTSGSTGAPKLVALKYTQLQASARQTGEALGLASGISALVCLNINYIAGKMMLVRAMELGWDLTVIEPLANPLLAVGMERFNFVAMVPMQLVSCVSDSRTLPIITNLGTILLGGAPVETRLRTQLAALGITAYQSYGMTETVSHIALRKLSPEYHEEYTVLPQLEIGTDDRGCLYVCGQVTDNRLIQSNDLVELTGPMRFKWLGRFDNVINSGGVKIILDRIDEAVALLLYEIDRHCNYFSWYKDDTILGQKLILILEGRSDHALEILILRGIRKYVSTYETPKHVYFVEKFSKTDSDKVDKRETAKILDLTNE